MKIKHQKGTNFVTFYPCGTFNQKINGLLKLANEKIDTRLESLTTDDIKKIKSKKRHITFIPTLIKKFYSTDIVIFLKFKKKKILRMDDSDDNPSNFYYFNWSWKENSSGIKLTKDNLIHKTIELFIDQYAQVQKTIEQNYGLEYEMAPLYSLVYKFV
jgi:hypothetical protein